MHAFEDLVGFTAGVVFKIQLLTTTAAPLRAADIIWENIMYYTALQESEITYYNILCMNLRVHLRQLWLVRNFERQASSGSPAWVIRGFGGYTSVVYRGSGFRV